MSNNIGVFSISFLLLSCWTTAIYAEAYRWKDENGRWHFSDKSTNPAAENISGQLTLRNQISASSPAIPKEVFSQGNNISRFVQLQDVATPLPLQTYIFQPPLSEKLALGDIAELADSLFFSSHVGLIEFNRQSSQWTIYDRKTGLPGDSIENIAKDGNNLVIDVNERHLDGAYYPVGNFIFNTIRQDFSGTGRSVFDVKSGGGYSGLDDDVKRRLLTDAMQFDGKSWFTSVNNQVDMPGKPDGGVFIVTPLGTQTRHFTTHDGLSHDYCFKMAVTPDRSVWVTHWETDRGLSYLPYGKNRWETVQQSDNHIDLGGTRIAALDNYLLIGQHGRLVMYEPQSKLAMFLDKGVGLAGYNIADVLVAVDAVWITSNSIFRKGGYDLSGLTRIDKQVLRNAFLDMRTKYESAIADKNMKGSLPSTTPTAETHSSSQSGLSVQRSRKKLFL